MSSKTSDARVIRAIFAVTGSIIVFASLAVLICFEMRGVVALQEMWSTRDAATQVTCFPDPANNEKLVYATCALSNFSLFWDFAGLRRLEPADLTGIRLVRHAQVYRWHEEYSERSRTDYAFGRVVNEIDFTYSKVWSDAHENSDLFTKPITCALTANGGDPCVNFDPSQQPWWRHGPDLLSLGRIEMAKATGLRFGGYTAAEQHIHGGHNIYSSKYTLPPELMNQAGQEAKTLMPKCDFPLDSNSSSGGGGGGEEKELSEEEWCDFVVDGIQTVRVMGAYIYYLNIKGRSVALTESFPGDVRVRYTIFQGDTATVLAKQVEGGTFGPWCLNASSGASSAPARLVFGIQEGLVGIDRMMEQSLHTNTYTQWVVRGMTVLVAYIGAASLLASYTNAVATVKERLFWMTWRTSLGVLLLLHSFLPIIALALLHWLLNEGKDGLVRHWRARRQASFWSVTSRVPLLQVQSDAESLNAEHEHPLFKLPRRLPTPTAASVGAVGAAFSVKLAVTLAQPAGSIDGRGEL